MPDRPNIRRIDHVTLASSDLARTDAFYATVLGAEIHHLHDNIRQYRIGDQLLSVHGPGLQSVVPPDLLARFPVMPGGSDICFEWGGTLPEAIAHLAACGVAIVVGPAERQGARGIGTSVYFRDPDGSLLEFIVYGSGG